MRVLFFALVLGLSLYLVWPWISYFITNIKVRYNEWKNDIDEPEDKE